MCLCGQKHLQEACITYKSELRKYIKDDVIDGTRVQNGWFPLVEADIFISHSRKDEELACALAEWLNRNFGLRCFIDSNIWGCFTNLLD